MALFRVKSVFLAVVALQLGRYIAAATGKLVVDKKAV